MHQEGLKWKRTLPSLLKNVLQAQQVRQSSSLGRNKRQFNRGTTFIITNGLWKRTPYHKWPDYNRVALLMAKKRRSSLQNQDAYFKSTGGLKLNEPVVDFSDCDEYRFKLRRRNAKWVIVFIGEIGLTGEIARIVSMTVFARLKSSDLCVFYSSNLGWMGTSKYRVAGDLLSKKLLTKPFGKEN